MPKRWIERLLFAETCVICGEPLSTFSVVCDRCLLTLHPQVEENLLSIPYLDGYKIFTHYGEREKKLLHLIKFEGFKHLAVELGKLIAPFLRSYIKEVQPDLVGFIPTNPWRYWFLRGFDPVEEILKGAGIPYEGFIKRRWLWRKPLSKARNVEERKKLVRGVFTLKKSYIPRLAGTKVLLVDDVLTTGATASEIAYILKSVGVREVYLFAVFRPL